MNKELIISVYDLLVNKRISIIDDISTNQSRLEEVNHFIDDVESKDDFKFFSPYSTDDIYDNKVSEYKKEKDELDITISILNNKLVEYDQYVSLIHEFLDSCETEDVVLHENIIDEDNILDKYSNESLIHKLEIVSSFIKVDPKRAVDELQLCINDLKNI